MHLTTHKNNFSNLWLFLAITTITGTIIYSNIYNSPFVFDDMRNIVVDGKINDKIRDLNNYYSLERILKPKNIVSDLTFTINYKFCGLNVVGYHVVNVVIHILNGFLVYFLSLTIFGKLNTIPQSLNLTRLNDPVGRAIRLMSLFAALIFVAHPIQTEAVTYTYQRTASIAAMFYMASVLFYLKARINAPCLRATHRQESKYYLTYPPEWRSRAGYFLSGLCGVLAFLSKPNAGSLPGVILLVEYLLINRTWQGWRRTMPWFTVSFALWVIFIIYVLGFFSNEFGNRNPIEGFSSLSKDAGTENIGRWQYLSTQFNVLVIYIRLLFLPINQNLDYAYPFNSGFLNGYTPIAFSFLIGLVALGIIMIRKRPIISLAIFWFFITLSVESSIIPIRDALFEHRLYLPMFGFAVFVSWLLFYLFPKKLLWVIVTYIIIIMSLCVATYYRNGVWQDERRLWSDVLSKSPKNHRAHYNLGTYLVGQDKKEEAITYFKEAVRINPNFADAHINLGNALSDEGKLDESIPHFLKALEIKPNDEVAHFNLGNILAGKGELDEAISHYKEALQIKPKYAEAHNNLGANLIKKGKLNEAISHLKEALQINPNVTEFHNNLQTVLNAKEFYNKGLILDSQGQIEDAITEYRNALQTNPSYAEAHNKIGIALAKQNKLSEAVSHFSKALQIMPDYVEAHFNIGITLSNQNRLSEAIEHFSEAIKINPNYVEAYVSLGVAFLNQGEHDEAITRFSKALQIKPNYAKAHNNLGLALAQNGNLNEAIKHFSEALRINPDFKEAQYNLELALKEAGKNDKSTNTILTP